MTAGPLLSGLSSVRVDYLTAGQDSPSLMNYRWPLLIVLPLTVLLPIVVLPIVLDSAPTSSTLSSTSRNLSC